MTFHKTEHSRTVFIGGRLFSEDTVSQYGGLHVPQAVAKVTAWLLDINDFIRMPAMQNYHLFDEILRTSL